MEKIRYISLFSGIEAWSCAVCDMPEFEPVAFSEIDPFACAVLKHHYPNVPNLGDVTKIDGRKFRGLVDLIVGGSPCQGFSVAGQRKGLDDERSCLALEYVRLVDEVHPKMWLWENVPGCTSTNGGQDLRSFFAALDGLGYSLAWTILDSQHFGLAQRRRRVFAFGYLGTEWQRCAKILLEPESMCRNPPACRQARKADPASAETGAGNYRQASREREQKAYQIANGTVTPATVSNTLGIRSRNGPIQAQTAIAVLSAGPSTISPMTVEARTENRHSPCGQTTVEPLPSPCITALENIAGTVTAKWAKGTGGPSGDECYNLVLVKERR